MLTRIQATWLRQRHKRALAAAEENVVASEYATTEEEMDEAQREADRTEAEFEELLQEVTEK